MSLVLDWAELHQAELLEDWELCEAIWRRLSGSGAAWSFYRDNIEEEFTAKRVSDSAPATMNPLDELFRKPG